MKTRRFINTVSVLASAALILGAFVAGPADAKKKKPKPKPPVPAGCPAFTPVEPASPSEQKAEIAEAEIIKITDAHTADAPLVIEYEHGPALWDTLRQVPIQEDTVFFPIQIDSETADTGLYVFQEWAHAPGSDMDLYIWDGATGEEATHSGSANAAPEPLPTTPVINNGQQSGAWGLESVSGHPVGDCAGFVIESRAFMTAGEAMTMTIYLGEQVVAAE